jgi:RimJ/RimL family protein N-acetyltransferase
MHLTLPHGELRSWRTSDLESLVRFANNLKICLDVRDRFPHPYTPRHGRSFLRGVREREPELNFAIGVGGEAVGGIGLRLQDDIDRVSAEVGYWLGEPFWGRGLATEALRALTDYAVATHALTRIYAVPFARNTASCRVLEKAGYVFEGRLRRSAIKEGEVLDQLQYAFIAEAPSQEVAHGPAVREIGSK